MSKSIDIIVPVYNGLEELKQCVNSILENTDLTLHRLLIVDDKSPDKNVLAYLETIHHPGIVLLKNEVNLGFSASVNKGMEYSHRDVILLNSDTLVTKGWVEKIIECAYSSRSIASVTPLSNAATLCSVPEFLKDNPLPQGMSAQDMADLVERCSLRRYPKISVAVGFCMFIKREVIEKIGLFDAEAFEKGYGEENDFCYRAEKEGYIHVMCDDTFIYHKGTASFATEEKRKLIEEHEKILVERHEAYVRANVQYCQKNPNEDLQKNIKLHLLFADKKENTLILCEKFPKEIEISDGEFYAVRKNYSICVEGKIKGVRLNFVFALGYAGVNPAFADEKEEKILNHLIQAFYINEVKEQENHFFARETKQVLAGKIQDKGKGKDEGFDAKTILRGYMLGSNGKIAVMDEQDGIYGKRIVELENAYETLAREDKYKGEELYNIYHSKRFRLACALEKLIKPLKRS